jgi:AcrR family transcriptional regulator
VAGRRETQKAATRERILDAAVLAFAAGGIADTPTAEIAARAGVSHGLIFAHFPTRDALVGAAIERIGNLIAARLHELAEQQASFRDILRAHVQGLLECETFYGRLVVEGPRLPPDARRTAIGVQSAISFHLEEAARREMAAGRLKRVAYPLLFNTWLGLLHHYLANSDLFAPGGSVLARRGPELINHFMALVSP